jgi:uncharacterized membrane protein (Fun14 family)
MGEPSNTPVADPAKEANVEEEKKEESPLDESSGTPSLVSYYMRGVAQQITMAGVFGFASGACLKHVSKKIAVGVGALFISLNVLNYLGYVNVNWVKMEDDFVKHLDTDGDKKITFKDVQTHMKRFIPIMSNTTGFLGGLAAGVKFT